jgi:bacterioferritin-associated ferredoxin
MKVYKARAEIPDREWIELEIGVDDSKIVKNVEVKACGCHVLIELIPQVKKKLMGHPLESLQWSGANHSEILISEALLKIQERFNFPLSDPELCHCRKIPAQVVDQAIVLGAHSPEQVTRWTRASSGCGTCRPDVVKLIQFRLKKEAS